MEKHVTAVGVMHIGLSIIGLMAGIFIFALFGLLGTFVHETEGRLILPFLALFLGGGLAVASLFGLVGGIGLLKHLQWARVLILIVSAVNLVNIPIGTLLGAYSIWVLVQDETAKLFASPAVTPSAAS